MSRTDRTRRDIPRHSEGVYGLKVCSGPMSVLSAAYSRCRVLVRGV